jgi:hypothetical protein
MSDWMNIGKEHQERSGAPHWLIILAAVCAGLALGMAIAWLSGLAV